MVTIKSRIKISVVIIMLAIFGIVGVNYVSLKEMAQMQDIGAKRSQDAVDVKEASMGGLVLYHVIVDAMIERNLDKAAHDWAKEKDGVLNNFELVIWTVESPEEKKQAEEIKAAILEVINLFEGKLLPALRSADGITDEIRELHDKIDVQVNKVESGMDKIVDSLHKKMQASDEDFKVHVKRVITQGLIIGLIGILLQAWLANWLLRKEMDKRIEELATTKSRVLELEGLIPICMYCKKIRDDQNTWHQLERYFTEHSDAAFTHGMCPECFTNHMEEIKNKYP